MASLYEDLMKHGVGSFVSRYANFALEALMERMKIWPCSQTFDFELDPTDFTDPSAASLYHAQLHGHFAPENPLSMTLDQLADSKRHASHLHQFYQALDGVARRRKRPDVRTPDDVVKALREAKNVMVIAGAGISTSLGIPDFRSATGIYATINPSDYDLTEPQEIFDIRFFRQNPKPFYKFSHHFVIDYSAITPSPTHFFLKALDEHEKLMRVYTQNIDGIEHHAGVPSDRVIQCHGTVETASCVTCGLTTVVHGSWVEKCMMEGSVALCPNCEQASDKASRSRRNVHQSKLGRKKQGRFEDDDDEDSENDFDDGSPNLGRGTGSARSGVMKPDCVFFHEALPTRVFSTFSAKDHDHADLVIVVGSSLRVPPVNQLVHMVPPNIPRVLINRERLPHVDGSKAHHGPRRRGSLLAEEKERKGTGMGTGTETHSDSEVVDGEVEELGAFDVEMLGSCDDVVTWLSSKLGWQLNLRLSSGGGAAVQNSSEGWESERGSKDNEAELPTAIRNSEAAEHVNVFHGEPRFKQFRRISERVFEFGKVER
ncbi:DHS-like NAD/FAD-binding domain-containing protein [Gonapodya prolifera JEL478]|uniref:DHS-like NAD/FAD-binding domain-containing protein n=1 Tax=Gonapodya prolifera (strain JEL478) TaxID=1344416 RepID=A0A139AA29_GONPJ|nr:DHS-like NAD/FAD-binding domain-containing protein [Gonapodya prolifera JEL478]|eukprot:KXS13587.1 DHS-like NAD/FAD-binding domain-containing protein [Gonapodya prolifera JEL478]